MFAGRRSTAANPYSEFKRYKQILFCIGVSGFYGNS